MRVLFRRIQGKWTRIHRREKGFIKHAAATALIFWMLWLIIAPLIFIVLHHIRAFLSQYISMPTLNWASLGQMGDMFGGLNTLLNFFVLTGVVYASIVQTRQLRDARAALRNQKASSSIEAFDQSFFRC
ncbi:MAG: hypothetical protein EOP14_00895 [Pseudomonas sp.]|nr:MAG: hypothetical protein EOP14_00895 [Pseudomonas sp.]